jgi:hypothetical protein
MVTTDTVPRPAPAAEVVAPGSPSSHADRGLRGTRPRNQYWDVVTASWRTGVVIPTPRQGD